MGNKLTSFAATILAAAGLAAAWRVAVHTQPRDARVIYVDQQITPASCTTYNLAARSCAGGDRVAHKTLTTANAAVKPGVTVLIRGGEYSTPIAPAASGTPAEPIVFRGYERETVVITGVQDPAIQLIGRAYITIEGLTLRHVLGWARLQDAHDNEIRHVSFEEAEARGTTGALKLVRSWFNRIIENRFREGYDLVVVQDSSDGNVFMRNAFSAGHHSELSIRCSNGNVVRLNSFENELQKAMEIYDCDGVSDAPVELNATKRNLVEFNRFGPIRGAYKPGQYDGIQLSGQYGIFRRNVFARAMAGGITVAFYEREALYVTGNRIYHNTFVGNRCFAIDGAAPSDQRFRDNRVVNNIFYMNRDCEGNGAQVDIQNSSAVILKNNGLETTPPGFVDEARNDFHLTADSRMIDRGVALTTASMAGEGTSLTVADPTYFSDGSRIPGELGDEIQLIGSTESARVLHVNFNTRALTLDRPLAWKAGQGVALKYAGSAPDLGAIEFEGTAASVGAASSARSVGPQLPFMRASTPASPSARD